MRYGAGVPSRRLLVSSLSLVVLAGDAAAATALPPSFSAGLAGPVLTYLHLLGLLGLGLWLDMQGQGSPGTGAALALVAGLLFGVLTRSGIHIPYAAYALEASLVLFGGLLAFTVSLPRVLGLVLAAIAGALHGIALSQWDGASSSQWLFWPGLVAGCLLALSAGVGLSATLYQFGGAMASRLAGAAIALVGVLLLLDVM
ncbi:HupE/UreJ family protein [Niveispirillum sp. BGYR6]|uniref:HupE/UreJ family protein n=1 Tax=Niveispirillum sp. BGYR6 TaxID=2971249 RepID=UPI0022B9758E|nr:HupE/UreJ family protein [Niveispirillum sp. BGYR6]MDG5493558.1 HupE/UreJ family protein [Niveispirillum sp. BGYR6]